MKNAFIVYSVANRAEIKKLRLISFFRIGLDLRSEIVKYVTRLRPGLIVAAFLSLLSVSKSVTAQNVADNIRPVGSVCLAGQACVGTEASTATVSDIPSIEVSADVEPERTDTSAVEVASEFDAEAAYQMSCNACHGAGAAGAPMLGDSGAWESRLEKGMEALLANVVNGVGAMPARGICMTCSDDDLQAIVEYMLAQN